MSKAATAWRNRIVGSGEEAPDQLVANPAFMTYTPADSSKWTGADPTTVAAALDRIAAALGPIA